MRSGLVEQPGMCLPHGSQPLAFKVIPLRLCRHHAVGEKYVFWLRRGPQVVGDDDTGNVK